ncbi:MAG: hypothetical protein OXU61_14100 [Gammaproteobacteria bacterium]|nr:hypothetical protein [Gammaproteobacteria bacterium]
MTEKKPRNDRKKQRASPRTFTPPPGLPQQTLPMPPAAATLRP